MPAFSQELFLSTLGLIGAVIVISALFSGAIERSGVPQVAVFLGIGTQLLHLATVYYFGVKVGNASELYGPLGVAATLLLWAYIVSRLVLTSASINVAAVRTYHHPD